MNSGATSTANAIVTGAAGGIGSAVVRRLLAAGSRVAVVDADGEGLAALRDGLPPEQRDRTLAVTGDLTRPETIDGALHAMEEQFGPVTALTHAAGILHPAPVQQVRLEDWHAQLAVNATAVLLSLQAVGGAMKRHGGGAIVVVGSNAARVPRTGMAAYAASKAAAAQLVRVAGLELAPFGVRCNVVEPGSTDTAMQRDLWPDQQAGERAALLGDPESWRIGIPLGRIAAPGDVAEVVAFLLSDQARHVTMQRLLVDGGASL